MALALSLPCVSIAAPPDQGAAWHLVFSDDFNGKALDRTKWDYNYPWGRVLNHCAYLDESMVSLRHGRLVLTAVHQRHPDAPPEVVHDSNHYRLDYTAGAVHTKGRFHFTYGYIEARMKMPAALGTWPAFWMLREAGGWPPEIDILEIPHARNLLYLTYHYGKDSQDHHTHGGTFTGPDFSQAFHDFGCLWTPELIAFYVDGQEVYRTDDKAAVSEAQDMYLLINHAVGGWAGLPPPGSVFPNSLEVEWVRLWQLPVK